MGSMGQRIREERERLGLNQTKFAALAGQSKNSQIRYESGERSPDGDYLQAIALAGARIGYIVTGQAEPTAVSAQLDSRTTEQLLDDAASTLSETEWPVAVPLAPNHRRIREDLLSIAAMNGIPPLLRARADFLLSTAFNDEGATERKEVRFKSVTAWTKLAHRALEQAFATANWTHPPKLVYHALLGLSMKYGIEPEDLVELVSCLKSAIKQGDDS